MEHTDGHRQRAWGTAGPQEEQRAFPGQVSRLIHTDPLSPTGAGCVGVSMEQCSGSKQRPQANDNEQKPPHTLGAGNPCSALGVVVVESVTSGGRKAKGTLLIPTPAVHSEGALPATESHRPDPPLPRKGQAARACARHSIKTGENSAEMVFGDRMERPGVWDPRKHCTPVLRGHLEF